MSSLLNALIVGGIIGIGTTISRKKVQNSNYKKYWWVYALILALMGIGALLYYYI